MMFDLTPLQMALREKASQRQDEYERTADIRFQWAANLLNRFAEETASILNIGEMDQLEQAYENDAAGRFRAKVDAIISEIGFSRQYVHAGLLVHDILSGEQMRPTTAKADAAFDKMMGLTK